MTPKRRHHSGSVRVQRLTLKSNKRATDLLLYDIDCYVWHKNQHNSFFCRESNVWVFTSNGRSSCPQWMEFVRHRGRLHNWKPPASWHQRPLGWGAWFRSICSMLQTCLRQTHVWHIAVHSGICAHTEVIALFLSQPLSLFCSVRCFFFLFLWSRHLAAQIVSHRARLPSKACVQPDVSVTYFIIGSNQHQSPIKHEAVADGGCVLRCLVCLSGSVKYLLIRKKGNPCFPAGWMLPSTAFND